MEGCWPWTTQVLCVVESINAWLIWCVYVCVCVHTHECICLLCMVWCGVCVVCSIYVCGCTCVCMYSVYACLFPLFTVDENLWLFPVLEWSNDSFRIYFRNIHWISFLIYFAFVLLCPFFSLPLYVLFPCVWGTRNTSKQKVHVLCWHSALIPTRFWRIFFLYLIGGAI